MRLFFKLASVSIRSQMQHKASFFMLCLGYFFASLLGILGIWVLFDRFKMVEGWTFSEVCILYGIVHIGFSIAECFARGFDNFDLMVKHGHFDRVLLRPLGTLFQVATSQIQPMRLARLVQGLLVLLWGLKNFDYTFADCTTFAILIIILSICANACLFYGLFILQAVLAFWTTETLELCNITTFGGVECSQYPLSIYPAEFRLFFTFVIPLAFVSYYPVAILLGHETWSFLWAFIFPLVGILFLFLSCILWQRGVRKYTSTGS